MDICIFPRPLVRRMVSSDHDAIHLNGILSVALIAVVFTCSPLLRVVTELPHFCVFEWIVGVPCPGCDMTLALFQIAHLQVAKSISTNPAGLALLVTTAFQVAIRSSALARLVTFSSAQRLVGFATHAFGLFLLIQWINTVFNSY